jgi:hypothetical protein
MQTGTETEIILKIDRRTDMKEEEHTHLVRTDIARNSELKGKLDSAQALETKLEAANLRMKDKISGLDKLLDNSNNENEQLKTTTSKLKDKVTELTLMLDNNRSILPPCHSLLLLSGDITPLFCTRAQAII